ncbi:MAG: class I SAM-dependent methyltransferase, partial [Nitrospirae bacterium]|nr:class I SAM-dependent methyltransferase [Candidatus Manganitrophaceae bacterium]
MNLIEKATIMHYHRHRIASYKTDSVKALGWRGSESQLKRFEVLASIGDLNGACILDVGCGYGDLKAYLDQHFSDFVYIGIDQMPEFISEAKRTYQSAVNTAFYQCDFST